MPDHPHSAIARRLKRADGHLHAIIEMIEQGRPCVQIAQQLQAVESAIENAKKALIRDHISECIERPLKAAGLRRSGAAEIIETYRQIPLTEPFLANSRPRSRHTAKICSARVNDRFALFECCPH